MIKIIVVLTLMHVASQETIVERIYRYVTGEYLRAEPDDVETVLDTYDFIIVGAGTAGCVLANRLTENPEWKVLLIEAGGPEDELMDVPILANYLQFTEANWHYKTEPSNRYCLAMEKNQCNYPRGKVMGGSSVLNYMIYTRGNRRDFDNWSKMGNEGWSYDEVLPYFKKIENFKINTDFDPEYHSTTGPLWIENPSFKTKLADTIIEAGLEAGLSYVDYNGREQAGISRVHVSTIHGKRDSSNRAYLHAIKNRTNLHVKKYSTVTEILIDRKTKEAYGVVFVCDGVVNSVKASKEVILSAGAINTPQLLMLSGIGPKEHLTALGIPLIEDLKVGYNLMDHVILGGVTFLIDQNYSITTNTMLDDQNLQEYLLDHAGPYTIPGGVEVVSFHELANPTDPEGYPDIEYLFLGGAVSSDRFLQNNFGFRPEIYDAVFRPIENKDAFMVFVILQRPKSKGRVTLKNKSYQTKPLIDPNYFDEKIDMDTMVAGANYLIKLMNQRAMKKLGIKFNNNLIPDCEQFANIANDYWECMTRYFTFTNYHQSGTCKMGPEYDETAVVNPRLQVRRMRNLRVIDVSILPEIPVGHTNAPTYMIAEKGADMIKEDWDFLSPKREKTSL